MIRNKEILDLLEKKKRELSCVNCKCCNLNAFHKGQWYCRKRSILSCQVDIEKCFENGNFKGEVR